MRDDLLQAFGFKPNANTSGEAIPIFVKGYILPPPGTPETENNARVLGVRWDTNERVEIALRQLDTGSRPLIAQFKDDSNSSTPVTTEIGGTILVEAAYLDSKLAPLSGQDVKVFNGRWLNRVSPNKEQGWALRSLARVNEPRLMDAANPAAGKTQTITIMAPDKTTQVQSLAELDAQVLNALDSAQRDADPKWFTRPGAVNVFVRLSSGTENNLIELSGGFYQPSDSPYPAPNTRAMVQANLANNQFWTQKRELLSKALSSPNYKVEVIPGSTVFVGRKTLIKSLQSEYGSIKGVSRDVDGKQIALFTESVIGIRRAPKSGLPQALNVTPFRRNQVASLSGVPNTAEIALYGSHETAQVAPQQPAAAEPQPQVQNQASPQAPVQAQAPQAPQAPSKILPLVVRQHKTDLTKFIVEGKSEAHITTLLALSQQLGAPFDEKRQGISITNLQLPMVLQAAKRDMHEVEIFESKHQANHAQAAAPQEPVQAAQLSQPVQQPEINQPTSATAAAQQEQVDLSQLDLSNLDLDSVLGQAYQSTQTINR